MTHKKEENQSQEVKAESSIDESRLRLLNQVERIRKQITKLEQDYESPERVLYLLKKYLSGYSEGLQELAGVTLKEKGKP